MLIANIAVLYYSTVIFINESCKKQVCLLTVHDIYALLNIKLTATTSSLFGILAHHDHLLKDATYNKQSTTTKTKKQAQTKPRTKRSAAVAPFTLTRLTFNTHPRVSR